MKISIAIELDEGQYSILKKEETSTGIWYGLLSDDDVYTTTDYLEDRMIINNVQEGFYNGMQIFTYDVEFVSAAYKYGEQPEFKTTAKYEDASVLGQALFYNFDIDFFAIDNNIFRKEDLSVKIDINNLLGRGSTTLEFNQNSQDKSTVFDQIRKFWTDNDNMNTWLYHYAEDNFAERNQNVQFLIRLNPDNDIEQQSADISHEFGEQCHDMIWGSRLKEYSYGDKLHLFNNFPQEVKEEIMPAFLSRWSFSPNATLGEEILKTISGISPEGKEKIKESLLNEVNEVNDEVNPIRCLNILNFCTVFSDIKYSDINTEDLIRKTNMHSPQSVLKEIRNCLCNNEEKEKFDKDWNGSRVYYPTISEMSIAYRIWNWHYNVDSERREAKQNLIAVPIKDGLSRNDIKRIIKDDGECFKKIKTIDGTFDSGYVDKYDDKNHRTRITVRVDNISKWLFGVPNGGGGYLKIEDGYAILPGNSPRQVTNLISRLIGDPDKKPLKREEDVEPHRTRGDITIIDKDLYKPEKIEDFKECFEKYINKEDDNREKFENGDIADESMINFETDTDNNDYDPIE